MAWGLLLLCQWAHLGVPLVRADDDATRTAAIYSEFAKAFDTLEFEGDGKLDRTSFSQLVFDMGVSVTRSNIDDIFDEIDSPDGEGQGNDDGRVSPSELGAWWGEVSRCSRRTTCGTCAMATKCAWCLEAGICVNDEVGLCAGPEDHVGMAGTATGCQANAADMIEIASAGTRQLLQSSRTVGRTMAHIAHNCVARSSKLCPLHVFKADFTREMICVGSCRLTRARSTG